jgi:hypothetical protein
MTKTFDMAKKLKKENEEKLNQKPVYGNPEYDATEDIYSKEKKLTISDDDDAAIRGTASKLRTGADLDVPGSELDDADEQIGEEDEENNYYSLGGDDHDDLEEDKGE